MATRNNFVTVYLLMVGFFFGMLFLFHAVTPGSPENFLHSRTIEKPPMMKEAPGGVRRAESSRVDKLCRCPCYCGTQQECDEFKRQKKLSEESNDDLAFDFQLPVEGKGMYAGVKAEHCEIVARLFDSKKTLDMPKSEPLRKYKERSIKERRSLILGMDFPPTGGDGMVSESISLYKSWELLVANDFVIMDMVFFLNKPERLSPLTRCTTNYSTLDPQKSNCYLVEHFVPREEVYKKYVFVGSIEFPVRNLFLQNYRWLLRTDADVVLAPELALFWPRRFTVCLFPHFCFISSF